MAAATKMIIRMGMDIPRIREIFFWFLDVDRKWWTFGYEKTYCVYVFWTRITIFWTRITILSYGKRAFMKEILASENGCAGLMKLLKALSVYSTHILV